MAYRFGDFVLEPRRHRLRRGSEEYPLRPKTFDSLLYLVEHSDRVVTKEDLLEHVWGGAHVVEAVIARSISELRSVLGEDVHLPRYIQTVPRVGYKFIADVAVIETSEELVPETEADSVSIAVLPFTDMSPEGVLGYLCDGLSEGIINALTQRDQNRAHASAVRSNEDLVSAGALFPITWCPRQPWHAVYPMKRGCKR